MSDPLHTAKEAAATIGTTERQLWTLIRTGEIVAVNIAISTTGRPRWRIPESSIRDFIERRKYIPPAPRTRRRRRNEAQPTRKKKYFS